MLRIVLMLLLFCSTHPIRVGQITDYVMVGTSIGSVFNRSKDQCTCQMAKLNAPTIAANYFQLNGTCQLFICSNSSLVIRVHLNATFLFINRSSVLISTVPPNGAFCNYTCQNNGTCNTSGLCTCASGWSGAQCDVALCSLPCENSGYCSAPDVCTCYGGWTGARCQTVRTILWSFDNTLNDASGQFIGTRSASPVYARGIDGYGSALTFNGGLDQCVVVNPYLNMSYVSFTWEFWIYPTVTMTGDSMFIGQCSQPSASLCLVFMTRNNQMWFAFWANDVIGSTLFVANQWAHLAFVYDATASKQSIYLNGILEATQSSAGPLQVTGAIMTFGCRTIDSGASYENPFTGYLDQLLFNSRVKNASEILSDATLVVHYRFLASTPLSDSGPNSINGSWANGAVSIAAGIVDQAINFSVSGSYFQFTGLTLLATTNWPFSLSIWFKTNVLNGGGTIAHLSANTAGTDWCIRFIGLTAAGAIEVQGHDSGNYILTGPVMPIAVWNHVVYTFSTANGIRLYVNGTLYGALMKSYMWNSIPATLTLGNPRSGTSCGMSVPNQQFYGSIDEVRLYSRELTTSEIAQLYANP